MSTIKEIVLFTAQGVQDEEFIYPYYRLQELENIRLSVVLSDIDRKHNVPTGKYGVPIRFHYRSDNYYKLKEKFIISDENDIIGVVIPGGWQAPEIMRLDPFITDTVQACSKSNLLVAAICHGPQVMISAGIVNGRTISGYKGIQHDIENAGGKYVDNSVVIDKNFITANHYNKNAEWMKAVINYAEK